MKQLVVGFKGKAKDLIEITKDYLKSEEHKDYKKSEYDALTEYLRNRNYIK